MGKKLERLTLPPQIRIGEELKRQIILTAEADRRSLNFHIGYLLELGLKLWDALQSKEVVVRIRPVTSGGNLVRSPGTERKDGRRQT